MKVINELKTKLSVLKHLCFGKKVEVQIHASGTRV